MGWEFRDVKYFVTEEPLLKVDRSPFSSEKLVGELVGKGAIRKQWSLVNVRLVDRQPQRLRESD